eukprot:5662721-Heterocapsa_arctica.AAC.1
MQKPAFETEHAVKNRDQLSNVSKHRESTSRIAELMDRGRSATGGNGHGSVRSFSNRGIPLIVRSCRTQPEAK